jgi:hypothetical protein
VNKPINNGNSALGALNINKATIPNKIKNNPMNLTSFFIILKNLFLYPKDNCPELKRQINLSFQFRGFQG